MRVYRCQHPCIAVGAASHGTAIIPAKREDVARGQRAKNTNKHASKWLGEGHVMSRATDVTFNRFKDE